MGTEDIEKMICDKCNGEGSIYNEVTDNHYIGIICPKCLGHKKLDWIENIVGKDIPKFTEEDFFRQEYPIGNKVYMRDIVVGKGESKK